MNNTTSRTLSLNRLLPALGWLRTYNTSWLRGDMIAGITLASTTSESQQKAVNHPMLSVILLAGGLVAVTVAVHAMGLTGLLKIISRTNAMPPLRFWPVTWFLIRVA